MATEYERNIKDYIEHAGNFVNVLTSVIYQENKSNIIWGTYFLARGFYLAFSMLNLFYSIIKQPSMVTYVCIPSTQEAEVKISLLVWCQPGLHSKFSLHCMVKPYLKKTHTQRDKKHLKHRNITQILSKCIITCCVIVYDFVNISFQSKCPQNYKY